VAHCIYHINCLVCRSVCSFPLIKAVLTWLDTFLYAFLVPILGYIFENRIHTHRSQTQHLTSAILAIHGLCSAISGPVIGHFADKLSSRKSLLLVALAGCVLGTALIACAHSLYLFFLGRMVQGIAGSLVWIVGFATVAETVGDDSVGSVMGIVTSFAHAGIISGPMVSGFLFGLAGYWAAWSVPLAVLTVDIIARLIMVERPYETRLARPQIRRGRVFLAHPQTLLLCLPLLTFTAQC
jgi:MFS family permease